MNNAKLERLPIASERIDDNLRKFELLDYTSVRLNTSSFDRTTPQQYLPEQYLHDQVKRKDPSVSVVSMNDVKTIQIAPDQRHTLFTSGLGGCTAALIISQKPDGSSVATMTHYDPLHRNIHSLVITRDTTTNHTNLPESTKHTLLIVSPGDYIKIDERWDKKAKDESLVNSLNDAAKRILGENVETKVLPYSESQERGKSNGFIVHFRAGKEEPVRFEAHGDYFGSIPLKKNSYF